MSHTPANVWQGFGKRKNAVGMARPKKAKVAAREQQEAEMMANCTTEPDEQGRADFERKKPKTDVSHKLQAAEEELNDMYIEFLAAQKVAKVFEDKLKLAERLHDAKVRRIDAAQAKQARGSAVLQLERIYQNEQDLLQAELQASRAEAECNNAEANWLAQQCRLLRLQNANMSQ